jgi:hypothetical protein
LRLKNSRKRKDTWNISPSQKKKSVITIDFTGTNIAEFTL